LVNDRLGLLRFCKPSSKIGHGVGYYLQEWLGVHIGLFFFFTLISFHSFLSWRVKGRVGFRVLDHFQILQQTIMAIAQELSMITMYQTYFNKSFCWFQNFEKGKFIFFVLKFLGCYTFVDL
jgi:hypothetical protein